MPSVEINSDNLIEVIAKRSQCRIVDIDGSEYYWALGYRKSDTYFASELHALLDFIQTACTEMSHTDHCPGFVADDEDDDDELVDRSEDDVWEEAADESLAKASLSGIK